MGLEIFRIGNNDRLPEAVFYPGDKSDPKSIKNILGIGEKVFLCPSLPKALGERGITYLWNDKFNNCIPDLVPDAGKKWLMIEMTAVEKKVPPPHSGKYCILFLDGHTEMGEAPEELRKH